MTDLLFLAERWLQAGAVTLFLLTAVLWAAGAWDSES